MSTWPTRTPNRDGGQGQGQGQGMTGVTGVTVANSTASEAALRRRILMAATAAFLARGYSGVTMQEIAAGLGMSKKTLYRHFVGKEELLLAVVDGFIDEIQTRMRAILDEPNQAFVDRLRRFLGVIAQQVGQVQTAAMLDIERTSPAAFERITSRRRQVLEHEFTALIEQGMTAGMLREGIRPAVVVTLLLAAIERLATPEALERLEMRPIDIFQAITTIVFEGILSETARSARPVASGRDD